MQSGETKELTRSGRRKGAPGNPISRFFARIVLFFRQILDELSKVVRPTQNELWNYVAVVIVFVTVMVLFIAALDFGFSRLIKLVFGTN